MTSKGSLQSICWILCCCDFWPGKENPALETSFNFASFVECYPYFLKSFLFLLPVQRVRDNVSGSGGKLRIQNSSGVSSRSVPQ